MTRLWRWLCSGNTDLVLPKTWLASEHLRHYEVYTATQLDQGCVVSDVAAMRRKAFWKMIAAKPTQQEPARLKVVGGRFT